jgi:pyruvate kinase
LNLPVSKTKIICTVGPSSRSPSKLEAMIESGMNVARLNFAHGDFKEHTEDIRNVRACASKHKRMVSIMIDLPGVKMRIGNLSQEPLVLKNNEKVVLTTKKASPSGQIIPVEYKMLPKNVSRGQIIFLNDGFIQLQVERIVGPNVFCRVLVGGKLTSHKGLNLPGVKLNINPITDKDLKIVDFGLKQGVNIFGLSFVERAKDIIRVREFAKKKGHAVYLVAKIERRQALENFLGRKSLQPFLGS